MYFYPRPPDPDPQQQNTHGPIKKVPTISENNPSTNLLVLWDALLDSGEFVPHSVDSGEWHILFEGEQNQPDIAPPTHSLPLLHPSPPCPFSLGTSYAQRNFNARGIPILPFRVFAKRYYTPPRYPRLHRQPPKSSPSPQVQNRPTRRKRNNRTNPPHAWRAITSRSITRASAHVE